MFDVSKVTSVYSGRKGCACGCRGKYTYASKYRDERPSYVTGDEWINDQTIRMMTKKIENLIRTGAVMKVFNYDDFFAVDLFHDRTYTIYFAKSEEPAA